MYSFRYDEGETWAVWPKRSSLSSFNESSGSIVISQIIRQLLDDVRQQMNDLKDKIQNEKSHLTTNMNKLLTTFESYRTNAQTNENFARYVVAKHYDI